MAKFKVVRYWDPYSDRVTTTCYTKTEEIYSKYRRSRKPMHDYLVRKEGE